MDKKVSVLFVDDEKNELFLLRRLFSKEVYKVGATSDIKEAIQYSKEGQLKVVVSDQMMPGMTGIQFLKKIKEINPKIIRILLTSHEEIDVVEQAINLGEVYRFLRKPLNTPEVKSTINQSIEHYDLCEENERLFEETKRKKKELEKANRELKSLYDIQKDFIATVSHEIRTPLASIKGAVDIVVNETAGTLNDDQKNFLFKAKKNISSLEYLSNDVLALSKMDSGNLMLELERSDVNEVIQKEVNKILPQIEGKDVSLTLELASNLPEICIDQRQISKVLQNILSNGITFMKKGKLILTSCITGDKQYIRVCVLDEGCGIAEEYHEKIFQRFFQVGEVVQRETGGIGLGLSLCKNIVELHNGKIWVESKLNYGSQFYLDLPIGKVEL